ncbi:amidohydrolase family protein [Maribacter sp. 2307ULW6-5]|uniref:amidohydrolase family protein n=1 Tax=Maribacter sp. 2307ULW6-5 TaxID=3386275 RepID=UPI0039BCBC7C
MRIDAHQHFWRYDATRHAWIDDRMARIRKDFLPAHLEPLLSQCQMDGCIAVQAESSEAETEFLLRLAQDHPSIKGVVGWVDLCDARVGERLGEYAKNPIFKGVRHILQEEEPSFMQQQAFKKGLAQLGPLDLTYDLLVYPRHLEPCTALVREFPAQAFVLDHLGKPGHGNASFKEWERNIRSLAQSKNVYCKLSGMVTEAHWEHWKPSDLHPFMDVVLEAFGPQRLMFGSDWPVCLLAAEYKAVLAIVEDYLHQLETPQQRAIMGHNAAAFYKLTE